MSNKKGKVCLRFKRGTGGARRCAKFDFAGIKRTTKTCKKFRNTKNGRKCARFNNEEE